MTEFINIDCREEFDELLQHLQTQVDVAVDTETNGLRYYRDNFIISISVYFPAIDTAYNIPFRHGIGTVDVKLSKKQWASHADITLEEFHNTSWQGDKKKQMYIGKWFDNFASQVGDDYFGNLPISWLEELKASWVHSKSVHYYHNASFDLHMLEAEGFPRPPKVRDTMLLLHIVHEDWGGIEVDAPFTWTEADHRRKDCEAELVGRWATTSDGKLKTKKQSGNRRLKWQSAMLGFEGATVGEGELLDAKYEFEEVLTDFILQDLHNDLNDGLVYVTIAKATRIEAKAKAYAKLGDKQRERIRAKVSIDSKANMWMLPADKVALYAMLDVVLTWKLHQHWYEVIKEWDNVELYDTLSEVHYHLAWGMERNGVYLDVDACKREIDRLQPVIKAYHDSATDLAHLIGYPEPDINLSSWQQVLAFLNWESSSGLSVLEMPLDRSVMPEFWGDDERISKFQAYAQARPKSTGYDVLEPYSDHPFIILLFEYRKAKKSRDTYLVNWINAVDGNGIVHGGMNSTGTVSGRWSSGGEAGNWQNIPDRNGYRIKEAIVERDEWKLFAIDYGQLEARLAAWIAENLLQEQGVHRLDPTMTNLFLEGEDLHAYTRDMIGVRDIVFPTMSDEAILMSVGYDLSKLDKPASDIVAKLCRQIGKTLNFGLLYNGSKYMASALLKIDLDVADVLVQQWRKLFPAFAIAQEYFTKQSLDWRKTPMGSYSAMYVTQPISNRHRKLHKYSTWKWYYEGGVRKGFNPQEASSKKTWNNIVQGLGGYLCTVSGMKAVKRYDESILRPFANIHDAIDGYVHQDHMEIITDVMDIMVDWQQIVPNLTVDLEGSNDGTWQGMSEVHSTKLWVASKGKEGYNKADKDWSQPKTE